MDEARNAELRRDIDLLKNILQNLWPDSETLPTFAEFRLDIRAELLRLYGFYLTFYGRAKNLKDYHARAKDLLTLANKIFLEEKDKAKAAETNCLLAFCYWNAGEVENCEAFLKLVEIDFTDTGHPVYLQVKINQMMLLCWLGRIAEAIEIFAEIKNPVARCGDIRLKILFNFESAILLQRRAQFVEAIFHFNESINLCRTNDNRHLLALSYNNLSLLYLEMEAFGDAHLFSDKSLEILNEIEHTGWIPHILDTKALILIGEEKYSAALAVVDDAIAIFRQGEDFKGLAASLWTRILCFLRLGRSLQATLTYGELQQIALERIGKPAARKYAESFAKEIRPIQNLPLKTEILDFERFLISRALLKTNGSKVEAAKLLKLKNHQTLSNALAERHPGLYEELGFRQRARRGSGKAKDKSLPPRSPERRENEKILRLDPQGKKLSFDFHFDETVFDTFYFSEAVMTAFGIFDDAVVAVRRIDQLKKGKPVLVFYDDRLTVAKVSYDEDFDLFVIYDDGGFPIILDGQNVIGEPFAFCLIDETGVREINFKKLEV
ncbi:MAG: tetratricopeptide repeat protein [Acidobacteria bacterium]|nr:tetratricopeptide repeat protein [Acidobacteriota bacterium]